MWLMPVSTIWGRRAGRRTAWVSLERDDNGSVAESLTDRELSVLRWLTTMMSVAEIADELCVSTNTVKTHVAAVYRKLGVAKRRDAVSRGRELRLL